MGLHRSSSAARLAWMCLDCWGSKALLHLVAPEHASNLLHTPSPPDPSPSPPPTLILRYWRTSSSPRFGVESNETTSDNSYWIFAHNGDVPSAKNIDKSALLNTESKRYTPVGDTDSEAVFCYFLNCLLDTFPEGACVCVCVCERERARLSWARFVAPDLPKKRCGRYFYCAWFPFVDVLS